MAERGFSIGEASKRSGVKVTTIRFYEEIGLISSPIRTSGNRRQYGEEEIDRLTFIRHARELGFEIEDIQGLLAMAERPNASCQEADRIARHHLKGVDHRINQLNLLRKELQRMIDECGHGRVCDCRVIQTLADHAHCQHHLASG
ncbi:DNA-binding transcriptional regulator, MerR family [Fulvimarina manganoxydans]|uniref:DNA-binding transcriptional regulator, MerR family n=1 Tax=Fulvimarina manganoxydans TaxID=937218 RepID=A0A1W2BYR5_9HYPH|nr:helix-turn-helix domain-containing protein [Fulvimarina manganoxydans]MCK5931685.1 helix-turn-helix domain-containing protein [Fulvimarina manganoxydans]SMC77802.1 DNA-binding transcriptional regulator, MerR family [Fulvimarina manganoxydans]